MAISFTVQGKPPKKSKWGRADASKVIQLRRAAREARDRVPGWDIHAPVRLELVVYMQDITQPSYARQGEDPETIIGDLDGLVSGICDYLQSAPDNPDIKMDSALAGDPYIGPKVPVVIMNDVQVVEIDAKKIESESLYYTVSITPVDRR